MPSVRALGLGFALALVPLACGPTYVASDADRSDGSGGNDPQNSGGASDGAPTGGTLGSSGSGGAPSGGGAEPGPASGGSEGTACNVDADCMLVADWHDECFSPDCSHPIAVTQVTEAADVCLVAWGERSDQDIPQACAAYERGEACPAICALPLDCPEAACDDGVCSVNSDPLASCEG